MKNLARFDSSRRCQAFLNRTGAPCKRRPIPGGTVCVRHLGEAPQVRAAAEARLAAVLLSSIDQLMGILKSPDPRKKLAAVKIILDRNGLGVRRQRVVAAERVGIRTSTATVDHLTATERQIYEGVLTEASALKRRAR